jgi:DNA-directed RNA polymerase specialized sigma24 family protein
LTGYPSSRLKKPVHLGSAAVGFDGRFNTTHWSVVQRAGTCPSDESATALETLCQNYWQPIFLFARRKGYAEADAKDLTQQFFHNLLKRNDFASLDPRKGKFRTFLLTAFTHFLANERDRAKAAKRGGGMTVVSLDELTHQEIGSDEPGSEPPASTFFDRDWARSVVRQGLEDLHQEMTEAGKQRQFEVLKTLLAAEPSPGDYAAAAGQLGVAESSVPVLVHRLRHRFREIVRGRVAQTVTSAAELEEEMRYLFEVLNRE